MNGLVVWPTVITCHGEEPRFTDRPPTWCPAESHPRRPTGEFSADYPPLPEGVHYPGHCSPFRTCSYCGSIHPGDLYDLLMLPRREGPCAVCALGPAPHPPQCPPDREPTDEEVQTWRRWHQTRTSYHNCRVTMGGSDWKYGWPHKFYVQGIPNPIAGQPCITSAESRMDAAGHRVSVWGEPHPAPAFTGGKFYSDHLRDLEPPAMDALAPLLLEHTGIAFERDEHGLKYRAPHMGYQR